MRSSAKKASDAKYRQDNPEKRRLANKLWRYKNRERVLECRRRYRSKNRIHINQKNRDWWKRNPEKATALWAKHWNLRRARKMAVEIEEAAIAWCKAVRLMPKARCYYCGSQLKPSARQIEHIIPISKGGGHTLSNLCVACGKCNATKKEFPLNSLNRNLNQPVLLL